MVAMTALGVVVGALLGIALMAVTIRIGLWGVSDALTRIANELELIGLRGDDIPSPDYLARG